MNRALPPLAAAAAEGYAPTLMSHIPRWLLPFAAVLIAVHLNYWMWDDTRVVLGLPVNLLYHVVFSLLLYPILRVVVRHGWPSYLSDD